MPSIEYGDPDYAALKCPECGNTEEFVEFSLWEGKQPFTVDRARRGQEAPYVDYEAWEGLDADHYSRGIWCARCERKGKEVVVWAVSDF